MHRFYSEDLETQHKLITMNEVESNHACKVLRLEVGSKIELINGRGIVAQGKIFHAHHKRCQIEISDFLEFQSESQRIHLAVCPTKSNDRFEWMLEKIVEIGVDEITPLVSENSERSKLNFERLEKVILSAVKQSLRTFKPQLNPVMKVKDFVRNNPNALMAHCNAELERVELKSLTFQNEVAVMIGPEGDFSSSEIELALQNRVKSVSLGKNRLRTETAGLVAVTLLNASRT